MGINTFKKSYFSVDAPTWTSFEARKSRYAIYNGFYSNDVYDNVHSFAKNMKVRYGLYKSIRALGSPGFVIAENYKNHIFAETLEFESESAPVIPVIENILKWSQWDRNKELFALTGIVCGDVGLRVVDTGERVYLEVIDPSLVEHVDLDAFGNVKAYTLEYETIHEDVACTYREETSRDGEFVVFKTFKNGAPFAFGAKQEWREAYGFVPFVWVRNINIGETYGQSEFFSGLSKFREVDDQYSLLGDQIRKTVNPIWLLKGAKASNMEFPSTAITTGNPEPWRQEQNIISTTNPDASIEPLSNNLEIDACINHLNSLNKLLERDYPELAVHRLRTEGNAVSGRALRIAQEPCEARIISRRKTYLTAFESALQMGMSIGGFRGIYPFDLNSYEQGELDFTTKPTPIYKIDPEDEAEIFKGEWEAISFAITAGANLAGILESRGYSEEQIEKITGG